MKDIFDFEHSYKYIKLILISTNASDFFYEYVYFYLDTMYL